MINKINILKLSKLSVYFGQISIESGPILTKCKLEQNKKKRISVFYSPQ